MELHLPETFRPGRFRLLLIALLAYCIFGAIDPSSHRTLDVLGLLLLGATIIELRKDETKLLRHGADPPTAWQPGARDDLGR